MIEHFLGTLFRILESRGPRNGGLLPISYPHDGHVGVATCTCRQQSKVGKQKKSFLSVSPLTWCNLGRLGLRIKVTWMEASSIPATVIGATQCVVSIDGPNCKNSSCNTGVSQQNTAHFMGRGARLGTNFRPWHSTGTPTYGVVYPQAC